MLTITVPPGESFDSKKNEFIYYPEVKLRLEHSLLSMSQWESKWNTPFLEVKDKTLEQALDYVRCMTISKNVNPEVYLRLSRDNINDINNYISQPMTATTINHGEKTSNKEVITSELIYYWMIVNNIPFECQKWHLNRLITLIDLCSVKNTPQNKMSSNDTMMRNAELNARRRAKLHTRG